MDLGEAARTAIRDALALARLQRDGAAVAVLAAPVDLPVDPLATFTGSAGSGRVLLWHGAAWLVAQGCAWNAAADGPGRHMTIAEAAGSLAGRCLIVAPEGPADLPCLIHAVAFEESPQPGPWGALRGSGITLPRRLLRRDPDGRGWRIDALAVRAGDRPEELLARLLAGPEPLEPRPPAAWPPADADFAALVEDAAALVRDGAMRKVVVARATDLALAKPPDLAGALARLRAGGDDATTIYAVDLADGACFLGATPELLFAADGLKVETLALAGTCRRGADQREDQELIAALFASTKERKEHGLVVEHLAAVLRPRCRAFTLPAGPRLRRLARMSHLETPLTVELISAGYHDLLAALHPTPAVCGLPTTAALSWISRRERLSRGLFAGVLGWSAPGRCRFVVPLRGGIVGLDRARLFAGAGVIETSEPAAELAETEVKLQGMREALAVDAR